MSNEQNETKHTPGPWICETDDGEMYAISTEAHPPFGDMRCTEEQAKANACLIAAAPDMLEALKLALDDSSFEDGHAKLTMDTLDQIRSAIAKAEGRE